MDELRSLLMSRDWIDKPSILVIAYQACFLLRQPTNPCGGHEDAGLRKHMQSGFEASATTLVGHLGRLNGVRVRCQCRNQS